MNQDPEPGASTVDSPSLVVITGLSGSGKSTVANCFEDLGWYCVDNLPLPLLERLLSSPGEMAADADRIAVVADVRTPGFAQEFPRLLDQLAASGAPSTLLFLEASEEVLVQRYSESRRPHPLTENRPVIDDIRREREILAPLRARADVVLDTTALTVHEIRRQIYRDFSASPDEQPKMIVTLLSFGFKHGVPSGADLVFDLRFLPNPHFEPDLRELTGMDAPVQGFLHDQPEFRQLVDRLLELLLWLLPRYREENRSYLTVAFGCTGGHHRSVAVAETLASALARSGWSVRTTHRDIDNEAG
jgi:UPF0042 nucleotide-binding protein